MIPPVAKVAGKVPVTQATLFRWASISKSLTAVTALQLWERNRLNLEADVRLYVPEFPAKPEPISAQHLLCNQGGIVHYSNGPIVVTLRRYEHPNPFKNVVRALDTFKHSPVINPPGEKYGYTTHGFILLSAAVERAGQQRGAHTRLHTGEAARWLGLGLDRGWAGAGPE